MNNPLTPVEALQREIDGYRAWLQKPWRHDQIVHMAALELAKADAESEAHIQRYGDSWDSLKVPQQEERQEIWDRHDAARTKLYEALQR